MSRGSKRSGAKGAKGKGLDLIVIKENATRTLSGFTAGQKAMLAIAGVAVVVGATVMSRMTSTTDWATLYGNLPSNDAAAVTQALTAQGVSYRLSAGGAAIDVPRKDLYQARLDLSAKNLPAQGSPGYALLDKQGITASEFRQRIDYQRALEGELSRTVRAINGVDLAAVHLVVPKEDLFSEDSRKPSASVLVSTRNSMRLTSGQVRSIVHLVASSVEGLTADEVTVADSAGRMLSAPGEEGGVAGGDSRADQTRAFEDGLARSLQDMVEQVTGVGHASVRVSAALNFDKRSVVTEKFDDNGGKPIAATEKQSSETFTGPGAAGAGAAATGGLATVNGVGAATPAPTTVPGQATGPATTTPGNDYKKTDLQREFSIGKVTEKLDAAPGTITRLSIAVLVDQRRKIKPAALRSLVAAAAGLDTKRGDTLQISGLNFDQTEAKLAKADLQRISAVDAKTQMFGMIRGGAVAFLALLTVGLGYRAAKKSSVRREAIALPSTSDGVTALAGEAQAALGAGPDGTTPMLRRAKEPEGTIDDLILRQPDDVAETLRDWLADRRA